jgi:uncharacterized protein YbjT (DUF2867 family)
MPEYCVTGGTGFIASHLIRALLAAGHTVRATVRDPSDEPKVGFLWELEGADERLQLLRADLLVEGSFDSAVSGVDASSTRRRRWWSATRTARTRRRSWWTPS